MEIFLALTRANIEPYLERIRRQWFWIFPFNELLTIVLLGFLLLFFASSAPFCHFSKKRKWVVHSISKIERRQRPLSILIA